MRPARMPAQYPRSRLLAFFVPTVFAILGAIGDAREPIPIAHRGMLREAPENTLPAFQACLELGFGFELDIRTTQDGVLVVIHDDNVNRTTDGGDRSIRELPWAKVQMLDAGSWFDKDFAGTKAPSLEQVLALATRHKRGRAQFALNVKHLTRDGERQLVSLVEKYQLLEDSFAFDQDDAMSRRLKALNPRFQIGQNVAPSDISRRIDEDLLDVFLLTSLPSPDTTRRLHASGKKVLFNFAGTSPSRRNHEAWNKARAAGIDGMLTDYPLECEAVWRAARLQAPISRVLFGSCIKEDQPAPILSTILERRPELFLFLGDNIYADTTDMRIMRDKYARLRSLPGFRDLMNETRVMATWDDHDYGVNDGGADYEQRDASQAAFLDFWGEPADSLRRKRPGVYSASIFGPVGKRLQVMMLDTRFFRGPLKTGPRRVGGPYYPTDDPKAPLLGDSQWKWLEAQLRKPAEFRVLVSSIQCVAESAGQETWSNLPHERQRLFDLIRTTRAKGLIIISGDRHWSELSRQSDDKAPYPVYDLTSSSLNQPHSRGTPTKNRNRMHPKTYHRENFGEISIDWSNADPTIELSIRDIEGQPQLAKKLRLSELQPGE